MVSNEKKSSEKKSNERMSEPEKPQKNQGNLGVKELLKEGDQVFGKYDNWSEKKTPGLNQAAGELGAAALTAKIEREKGGEMGMEEKAESRQTFLERISGLSADARDNALWERLIRLQDQEFFTAKGLGFTYEIRGGEMFVSRKSKSITQSTVMMAFHKALELGSQATGPKKLGTFGASYLYPVFVEIGVIPHRKT